MKKTIVFIMVALTGAYWLAGCDGKGAEELADLKVPVRPGTGPAPGGARWSAAKKPPLVQVAEARRQTISRTIEVTGDVVATDRITVRATVDGPVGFCPWREGDRVKRGEKLIEIERPFYREDVRAAEAALAVARAKLADLKAGARPEEIAQAAEAVKQLEECAGFTESDMKRIEQMVTSGSLPGEAMEKARVAYVTCKTQLVAAQEKLQMLKAGPTATEVAVQEALVHEADARMEKARATLHECVLHAPFDGVVTRVHVRPGDLATAKAPLLDLMEGDSLVVRFGVAEASALAVNEDDKAIVLFDALPGRRFEATIVRVYPELDPATRTRIVEAKPAADTPMVPGMFARVVLHTDVVADAVTVPDGAVLTNPKGESLVFVVAEGKARLRKVKTGIETERLVQIVAGVEAGELVAVAGHEGLKDGAPVSLPTAGAGSTEPGKR